MSDYKYEAETFEIWNIVKDIENLQERIAKFCEEIETDDTQKMGKQINVLKKTGTMVFNHLSSLNTLEDLQEYSNSLLREKRAKKVAALLQNATFLEPITMNENGITNEDIVAFQEYYDVRLSESGHGSWRWLNVWHDGHHITVDELYELGIRDKKSKEINLSIEEKLEAQSEPDNPYDHYGWVLPNGDYYASDFGTHEESAIALVEKMGWKEEFRNWDPGHDSVRLCRDFLVYEKGYILVHNPSGFGPAIVTNHKPETKAQRETLYDYFMHNGDNYMANKYVEEEYEY